MLLQQLPALVNVEIQLGDAWKLEVSNFNNMNLTGYEITGVIHPKDNGVDVPLVIIPVNLAIGKFDVFLSASGCTGIGSGFHSWCLDLTPPFTPPASPMLRTYFAGRFNIKDCK